MADTEDPRVTRSREAILAAARELLREQGPAALTHQCVAARAAVGRATVYRHWPRPEQLLSDAMTGVEVPFFRDPTTPVRPWLVRELRMLADQMAMPDVVALTTVMLQGAAWNPELAARRDRIAAALADRLRTALAMAVDTGELRAAGDLRDAPALLVGPLLYRGVLEPGPVSDTLLDHLPDAVGTWIAARPPSRKIPA